MSTAHSRFLGPCRPKEV